MDFNRQPANLRVDRRALKELSDRNNIRKLLKNKELEFILRTDLKKEYEAILKKLKASQTAKMNARKRGRGRQGAGGRASRTKERRDNFIAQRGERRSAGEEEVRVMGESEEAQKKKLQETFLLLNQLRNLDQEQRNNPENLLNQFLIGQQERDRFFMQQVGMPTHHPGVIELPNRPLENPGERLLHDTHQGEKEEEEEEEEEPEIAQDFLPRPSPIEESPIQGGFEEEFETFLEEAKQSPPKPLTEIEKKQKEDAEKLEILRQEQRHAEQEELTEQEEGELKSKLSRMDEVTSAPYETIEEKLRSGGFGTPKEREEFIKEVGATPKRDPTPPAPAGEVPSRQAPSEVVPEFVPGGEFQVDLPPPAPEPPPSPKASPPPHPQGPGTPGERLLKSDKPKKGDIVEYTDPKAGGSIPAKLVGFDPVDIAEGRDPSMTIQVGSGAERNVPFESVKIDRESIINTTLIEKYPLLKKEKLVTKGGGSGSRLKLVGKDNTRIREIIGNDAPLYDEFIKIRKDRKAKEKKK